jgi:hypothetical protein
MTQFAQPAVEARRDRYGRPYVTRLDGKETPYTRVTTVASVLDDFFLLEKWNRRNVAIAVATKPDYQALIASNIGDKTAINALCEQIMEEAKSSARLGTALHQFTEQHDRGVTPEYIPKELVADFEAYKRGTAGFDFTHIEQFVVLDDYEVAGTLDRVITLPGMGSFIGDLKTGQGAIDYPHSIAVQLAAYAHGQCYDVTTGVRTPLAVNQDVAIIIHAPVGSAETKLYAIDIKSGWDAFKASCWVHGVWRKRKDLVTPL